MRAIDADAFKDYIRESCEDLAPLFNDNGKVARLVTENFCKDIDEQPTIQPKRGTWIDTRGNAEWYAREYRCSECGDTMLGEANFCPKCGAKMGVTT